MFCSMSLSGAQSVTHWSGNEVMNLKVTQQRDLPGISVGKLLPGVSIIVVKPFKFPGTGGSLIL